jgi:hypothetical protein
MNMRQLTLAVGFIAVLSSELWEPMMRIDSAAALTELINAKGIKQKPTPPRQPMLQRPR